MTGLHGRLRRATANIIARSSAMASDVLGMVAQPVLDKIRTEPYRLQTNLTRQGVHSCGRAGFARSPRRVSSERRSGAGRRRRTGRFGKDRRVSGCGDCRLGGVCGVRRRRDSRLSILGVRHS